MFMPAKDVILLDMAIDDGVKLVISAGLVAPKQNKLKQLAEEAKSKQAKRENALPKKPPAEEETAA
jgi:uncharacterized membrane protein